jgi:hypothetical protein
MAERRLEPDIDGYSLGKASSHLNISLDIMEHIVRTTQLIFQARKEDGKNDAQVQVSNLSVVSFYVG